MTSGAFSGGTDPTPEIDGLIAQQVGWSSFDDHMLHTCGVVEYLRGGRLGEVCTQATRIRLEPGERCLAEGNATCADWRAVGDGSWEHRQVTAVGSISIVAAAHLTNAFANRARRKGAEDGLRRRWVPGRPGLITITESRLCYQNPSETFSL